jgi:diaminopimelate decarboxylase
MDTIDTESKFVIGDVSAVSLAERYATPLYAYDAETIRSTFSRICAAVPYEPRRVHYACVANSNLAIMRLVRAQGGGIHANTWGDAVMALQAGFEANDIVYSGSNISKADMLQLFSHGIAVNLNSLSQLRRYGSVLAELEEDDRGANWRRDVGLRVNLGDQPLPSRMGVHLDELDEIDAIAAEHRLRIVGVHYYRGTGTVDTDHFLKPFPILFDVARRFGATLQYVDVGGGFGFQYSPVASTQFDWEVFGGAVADMMEHLSAELGRRICLVLEPGRSVVASSGYLLTSVVAVDRRAGGGQVAGVDTTTSHISKETYRVYGGYRRIELVSRRSDEEPIMTDVVGCTTFSDDYIGRGARGDRPDRGLMLPPLREGDVLAVLDAGGYGFSFASNFLNKPRPAEVMVDSGRVRVTRRRETYEDMLRLQVY